METSVFTRTRLTLLAYFMLGWFAYLESALNPVMPFLIADLKINLTLGGLHISAFALGMVAAGVIGDRVADRFTMRNVFWGGGVGMLIGAFLIVTFPIPAVTLFGSLLMGIFGSLVMVVVQSVLSQIHREKSAIALMEANIVASVFASIVPILVGFFEGNGAGWRMAFWADMLFWGVLLAVGWRMAFPRPVVTHKADLHAVPPQKPLSLVFWLFAFITFLGVCIEWAVWVWGANYLKDVIGLEGALASGMVSLFTMGALTSRIISSRLLRTRAAWELLPASIGLVVIGFPLFWLGTGGTINAVGLFIVGLGAGNLFPLGLGSAVACASDQSNKASARISMVAGLAILINPPILGFLGDNFGLKNAYLVVPVLAILILGVTVWATKLANRSE